MYAWPQRPKCSLLLSRKARLGPPLFYVVVVLFMTCNWTVTDVGWSRLLFVVWRCRWRSSCASWSGPNSGTSHGPVSRWWKARSNTGREVHPWSRSEANLVHFFLRTGGAKNPHKNALKIRSTKRSYKAVITARQQSSRNKERDKKKTLQQLHQT